MWLRYRGVREINLEIGEQLWLKTQNLYHYLYASYEHPKYEYVLYISWNTLYKLQSIFAFISVCFTTFSFYPRFFLVIYFFLLSFPHSVFFQVKFPTKGKFPTPGFVVRHAASLLVKPRPHALQMNSWRHLFIKGLKSSCSDLNYSHPMSRTAHDSTLWIYLERAQKRPTRRPTALSRLHEKDIPSPYFPDQTQRMTHQVRKSLTQLYNNTIILSQTTEPNVVIEWLNLLLRIREVPVWILGPGDWLSGLKFFVVFLSPQAVP